MADYGLPNGPLGAYLGVRDANARAGLVDTQNTLGQLGILTRLKQARDEQAIKGALATGDMGALQRLPGGAQILGQLAQAQRLQTDAAESQRQQQFYSPENRAQFTTPGQPAQPAIPMPDAELGGGPARPEMAATPAQFDLRRFAEAGVGQGIKGMEPMLNHFAIRDQARATMEQSYQLAQDRLKRDYDLAVQKGADQRELARMTLDGKKELAQFAASLRAEPAPTVTTVVRNGKVYRVDARTGREIGEAPSAGGQRGQAMSATAQKELIQTDEEIQGGLQALSFISQAKAINDDAMGFYGAGAVSTAGTILPGPLRPKVVDTTRNLKNIVQNTALPQLKAMFGGNPTEGERKILLEVQGSVDEPPSIREKIFQRAEQAVKNRMKLSTDKAKALRDGTYFSSSASSDLQDQSQGYEPSRRASDSQQVLKFDSKGNPIP